MKKWLVLLLLSAFLPSTHWAQSACDDALPPRLVVGAQGRVTPGEANNVRDISLNNAPLTPVGWVADTAKLTSSSK